VVGGHHKALGMGLLFSPRRVRFLINEVPLYVPRDTPRWETANVVVVCTPRDPCVTECICLHVSP
jgi:hypothetical protein